MKKNKGFTLIELLVVIALLAVLSSVILASLNNAKVKSNNNSIKAALNQARIQADLFYSTGGTYTGVCDVASDNLSPRGINVMVFSAGKIGNYTSPVTVNGTGTSPVRCNAAANGWAAQVPLKNGTDFYCVDYTRKGIVTTTSIGASNAFCQ